MFGFLPVQQQYWSFSTQAACFCIANSMFSLSSLGLFSCLRCPCTRYTVNESRACQLRADFPPGPAAPDARNSHLFLAAAVDGGPMACSIAWPWCLCSSSTPARWGWSSCSILSYYRAYRSCLRFQPQKGARAHEVNINSVLSRGIVTHTHRRVKDIGCSKLFYRNPLVTKIGPKRPFTKFASDEGWCPHPSPVSSKIGRDTCVALTEQIGTSTFRLGNKRSTNTVTLIVPGRSGVSTKAGGGSDGVSFELTEAARGRRMDDNHITSIRRPTNGVFATRCIQAQCARPDRRGAPETDAKGVGGHASVSTRRTQGDRHTLFGGIAITAAAVFTV